MPPGPTIPIFPPSPPIPMAPGPAIPISPPSPSIPMPPPNPPSPAILISSPSPAIFISPPRPAIVISPPSPPIPIPPSPAMFRSPPRPGITKSPDSPVISMPIPPLNPAMLISPPIIPRSIPGIEFPMPIPIPIPRPMPPTPGNPGNEFKSMDCPPAICASFISPSSCSAQCSPIVLGQYFPSSWKYPMIIFLLSFLLLGDNILSSLTDSLFLSPSISEICIKNILLIFYFLKNIIFTVLYHPFFEFFCVYFSILLAVIQACSCNYYI